MKIYRALKSNYITQGFGENHLDWYKEDGMLGHNGDDWRCWYGEPIYHSGDFNGIIDTTVDVSGGIGCDVINKDIGFKLRYWHFRALVVHDGQVVKEGDLLGYGDSTGRSTGNHLHFSLKQVNEHGHTINNNNSYCGSIDMKPYFENVFILDVLAVKQKALNAIELARKVIFEITQKLKGGK